MGLKRCALWARGWEGKKKKATCTKRTSAYTKLQKKKKKKTQIKPDLSSLGPKDIVMEMRRVLYNYN